MSEQLLALINANKNRFAFAQIIKNFRKDEERNTSLNR